MAGTGGGVWRLVVVCLAAAAGALAYLGNELLPRLGAPGDITTLTAAVGALTVGIAALWLAFTRLARHFRALGTVQDAPARSRRDELAHGGDGRWPVVAAALDQPVLILREGGRIVDANPAAYRVFGDGATPGKSVHDLLDRAALVRAVERARGSGGAVTAALPRSDGREQPVRVADLGLGAGVVLVFPVPPPDMTHEAAALPPFPIRPMLDEPLATLPLTALRVVGTGVVGAGGDGGRVVAMGTVRLSGARLFRTLSLDVLVNPGGTPMPEPVAGVTAAMVAGERSFAPAWPVIHDSLHHTVVVGFAVEAALMALAQEVERAGLSPLEPLARLDLGRLAAALGMECPVPEGHLALPVGEAASRILQRAIDAGITTMGDAVRLAETTPGP